MSGHNNEKVPLSCRLGWHRWYLDGAMFNCADRCDKCGRYKHPDEGERLRREREAWMAQPKGESFDEAMPHVFRAMRQPPQSGRNGEQR